jgi:hypothetical protein
MTSLEAAIHSARVAPAPWDERRAAVVYDKAVKRRVTQRSRRVSAAFALALGVSVVAWAFLVRPWCGVDCADLGASEMTGMSDPAPADWRSSFRGDGGRETSVQ